MKVKFLLAVFLIVLVVTDHCHALFGLIPSLIGGLVSAFKGRRKRQMEARFEPQNRNYRKRELDLEKLFANMPDY
uniref:Mucroporin n=1 Tax=Lychas mucronatus TaxID=172552 RepID=NDB45_LYCMC|nr:RecName: Full=Mucroporin; AltName: Full=Antimicrobial peptide 36.21; AltName: Full=Non-disulfide-bridged peptide 4.5; Short=NDBP-4.5; Flags: Precursor [Lychas mucronatus]ACF93401.1 mucroporin [Lychas mucronatus]